jgi:hypothetical protein
LAFICFFVSINYVGAWGFWAHRMINKKAVATLPKGMSGFYGYYIDYVTQHSVDPDKKRYCDMYEGPHHFIDLDHYCRYPCSSFPHRWKDAVAKYSLDTLNKYGTLPWHISLVYYSLVRAFKEQDANKILQLSSDLGHYIADSYVPLHTVTNFDGQNTEQLGIHAFWETDIPELFGLTYNYHTAKAKYIENENDFVWKGVLSSADAADSVLYFEKELRNSFPKDKLYCVEPGSKFLYLKYSEEFAKAYSEKLNDMVEKRMRLSIYVVGCLWMSAWVDAGQPDLNRLIGKAVLDTEDGN